MKMSTSFNNVITSYLLLVFALSCTSEKESDILTSCDNSDLVIEIIETNPLTCTQQGSIKVTATGGSSPYLFSIDGEFFQSNSTFTDLAIGDYTITVTDQTECVASMITSVALSEDAISLTIGNITSASCGSADGSVTLEATGGSPPYSFRIGSGSYQDTPLFEGLTAGNHIFEAKDVTECTVQLSVSVGKDASDLSLVIASTSAAGCGTSSGTISVSASGGDGAYTYQLNKGNFGASASFAGLSSGSYTVTVSDGTNCTDAKSVVLLSGIKLATQIMPIISANCAVSGCHNGSQNPNLSTKEQIIIFASSIKNRTGNRSMPAGGGTLTSAQIANIACWVDDGALDN